MDTKALLVAALLACGCFQCDLTGRQSAKASALASDSLELARIQKVIEQVPRGALSLGQYLRKLAIGSIAGKCRFSVPVWGRTGPLFADDGRPEPRRREVVLDLPFRSTGQARIVMQVLAGGGIERLADDKLAAELNRILVSCYEDGSATDSLVVWQARVCAPKTPAAP
jgi:hypothetical protein